MSHTDQGWKMTLARLPWHVAAARTKSKKQSEEMLPSDPAICAHRTVTWLRVDIPTASQPWSSNTWGCVWESLPSRSGTAGLTSSSTFDVHGNPAKAACHLLRTFVKVVKQPWQQTHRQQQQQKGTCNTPWICFIKCSLIWFKHQMNWLWSLPSKGLIGRVSESQPAQVAGCLPWEIFPNPPWKTPTYTSRAPCLFTVPSTLSLWPPMSCTGALQGRSSPLFQSFHQLVRTGQGQVPRRALQVGDSQDGLTRQGGR